MEKVMFTLRAAASDEAWCERLRTDVAAALLDTGVPGLAVNVRDTPVRDSMMTITTLDPPVVAVISLWTQQHYGDDVESALRSLAPECEELAAYLVTESVPLPPPPTPPGERTDGLANIALLRRPADLTAGTWRRRWHLDHTPVAIGTQATFGYVQNEVVRALTPDAAPVDAIVEELFPQAAVFDLQAFFGASDEDELGDRMTRMVASTEAFGANRDIDTVPTSRYALRTPFTAEQFTQVR